MKVRDILEHFLSRADWVTRDSTVDRVIAGDPETDVDRCGVTWMPGARALRWMVESRMRLLICHEPTLWNHRDERTGDPDSTRKLSYIEDHGLVIMRLHDSWDLWPECGIPWAWAEFLGLGKPPVAVGGGGYQHRYDIEPVTVKAFATEVARRCASLGEPLVQVTGDGAQTVSRIGVGTGCGCRIAVFRGMGCDCSIVCDDGGPYWSGIQQAEDVGHPVIRVNHGTSEEPGMVTLTAYLNAHMPGLRAEHLPHGSTFRLMGSI